VSRAPRSSAPLPPAAEDMANGQSLAVTAVVSLAASSDQRTRPATRSASWVPSQLVIHSSTVGEAVGVAVGTMPV
jgi:hypothetical protein